MGIFLDTSWSNQWSRWTWHNYCPDAINNKVFESAFETDLKRNIKYFICSLDSRTDLPKVRYATALDWFLLMSFFYCIATLLEFAGVHYFTKVYLHKYVYENSIFMTVMFLLSRLVAVRFQHWSMTNGKILPKLLNIVLATVTCQSKAHHNIVLTSGTLSSVCLTEYVNITGI